MFAKRRVTPLVERYVADRGWHILSLHQPQHLFVKNGRRLARCAEPCDPWQATIGNSPSLLEATETRIGIAATTDEAVLAAMPEPGIADDLLAAINRLCSAVDSLRDCLQK